LISRAWYLFFLSLNNVANDVVNDPVVSPSAESLIASYDALLQTLAQEVQTQPTQEGALDQIAELQKQTEALALAPPVVVAGQALTEVDDTNVTLTLGGSPSDALLAPTSLTLGWTGTLAVSRGGSGASTAAAARTNFGATTLGSNLFTIADSSAVRFPRFNADNTVSALTAATFRTAIGAGTVTSVNASGGTTGLSFSGGPITGSGTVTLAGTLTVANGGTGLTSLVSGYIPYGNGTGAYSSSNLLQFDGTRLQIGGNAGDSAGLDVIRAGGTNYIAKFRSTTTSTPYGVAIEEPSGAAAGYPTLIVYSFAGASTWLRIDSGGNTYFSNVTTTAAAANAVLDTGTGYQLKRSTSSARFKRDIENIEPAVSANVFKLRPIWYRSKANDDNQNWSWYGLLAEEVAEVEPRLVQWGYAPEDYDTEYDVSKSMERDEDGDLVEREVRHPRQVLKPGATMRPDGVMYDRLSVMLLAELKKLRQEFDDYRSTHP
jgi:hypothetical protein